MAPDGVDAQPGGTSPESSRGGDMRRGIAFVVLGVAASAAPVAPAAGQQVGGPPPDTVRVSVSSAERQGNNFSGRFSGPALDADGSVAAFDSLARNLVPDDTNREADVFVRDQAAGTTRRISVSSTGRQANDQSQRPDLSGSGRYVAFDSSATNLVTGDDTNGTLDVFVHDRATGTTTLVSESAEGGSTGDGGSFEPAISRDGRFVAFTSDATDLTAGAVSGARDVFVRNLETGRTRLVSRTSEGAPAGGGANGPAISADGRYVTFATLAAAVPDDTNGDFDVFVRDRAEASTTRVSVSSTGAEGDATSLSSSISADGQLVAFSSEATTLVPDDTNDDKDAFVRNLAVGTTRRVSVSSAEEQADGRSDGSPLRGGSLGVGPDISANGRYVTFDSIATNLVPDDTNTCELQGGPSFPTPGTCPDVFVRDRWQGTTERASLSRSGAQGDGGSTDPAISADGLRVTFFSAASNLVPRDTNTCLPSFTEPGQCPDIFVRTG